MRPHSTAIDNLGKIPPQAIEIEEAILGALLMTEEAVNYVTSIKQEYFYLDQHQYIFGAIQELYKQNKGIDILMVTNELKNSGRLDLIGGSFFLSKIISKVSSSAHMEFWIAIIAQKYTAREIIRISHQAIEDAFSDESDIFELQNNIQTSLENIRTTQTKEPQYFIKLLQEEVNKLDEIQKSGVKITGLDTGYAYLNSITNGWKKGNLIIVAARPATGKSAKAVNYAVRVAIQGKAVGVFSLEMTNSEYVQRIMSTQSNVFSSKISKADLSEYDWEKIHKSNLNLPIYIDDTPALNIFDFRQKARMLKRKYNIELIVLDYLQLMRAMVKGGNREQEISTISRTLKEVAKELDIPIIALAQLSRDVEKSNRKPRLSDLRESGSIEQDADLVLFLHNENAEDLNNLEPIILNILAKHRGGMIGDFEEKFDKTRQKFLDKTEYGQ